MVLARPDRSIDRFHADPTRSFTLAASYYIDPAVYADEQVAVFQRSWQYVGHVSQVRQAGAYLTADIGGQRVFVLRGDDDVLRGFFNVCLHRGHSLLQGSGTIGRLITCPYHAWAYAPDGRLAGARMSDRMDDFDFDDYRLGEVAVEEFCGFVFVNLDPDPMPMDVVYPGAAEAIEEMQPDVAGLTVVDDSVFEIAGNWKNVADNLLECYHCHPAHPAFVDVIDMATYRNETFENWSIQSGAYSPDNDTYEIVDGKPGFSSLFLWPNLSIGPVPGQRGLQIFRFVPTEVENTRQTLTLLTPDGQMSVSEQRGWTYFNEVLGPEDVALVEDVQVGLNSLGYHQGRFICIPDRPEISEHAVHHFHQMLLDALAAE
ncbi:MAG: aromatic ring-hydroxylating dioxygenase subunit alpha [Actinomycetota bacterium]